MKSTKTKDDKSYRGPTINFFRQKVLLSQHQVEVYEVIAKIQNFRGKIISVVAQIAADLNEILAYVFTDSIEPKKANLLPLF